MKKRDFVLTTADGETNEISVYGKDNIINGPCLILVHGFKGFKDWGFGPYLAEKLAEVGFFVITFNFSLNGIGRGSQEFTELEKFSQNTFSREIGELDNIINAYKNGYFGESSNNKIALLGHSRGGAISLLTAHLRTDISALVFWGTISHLDRYSERQKEQWRKKGFFEVLNTRTRQVMRLNVSLLDDLEKNKYDLLNIPKAVSELKCPLLIAHGEQDVAVPLTEGEELYKWSDKSKTEFFKIPSAGHTFNIKHPFEGTNEKFEMLIDKTKEFLIEKLK